MDYFTLDTCLAHSNELILLFSGLFLIYFDIPQIKQIKVLGISYIILGCYTLLEFSFEYYPTSVVDVIIIGITQITGLILFSYFLLITFYSSSPKFIWIKRGVMIYYLILASFILETGIINYPQRVLSNGILQFLISIFYIPVLFLSVINIIKFFRNRHPITLKQRESTEFYLIFIDIGLMLIGFAVFFYIGHLSMVGNLLNLTGVLASTIGYFKIGKHSKVIDIFLKLKTLEYELQSNKNQVKLFQELVAQANSAIEAKSAFLANMSHELRTPLNAIIGFSEILYFNDPGNLNQEQQQLLNDILKNAKDLIALISNVLSISQLESNKKSFVNKNFEISNLIADLIHIFNPIALNNQIQINYEKATNNFFLTGDYDSIKQILANLLDNAIKFSPNLSKINIKYQLIQETVKISIIDTGCGIKSEDLPKIYLPFFQLENAYTKTKKGVGLGLYYSKILAEHIGATILYEINPLGGSIFSLILPI